GRRSAAWESVREASRARAAPRRGWYNIAHAGPGRVRSEDRPAVPGVEGRGQVNELRAPDFAPSPAHGQRILGVGGEPKIVGIVAAYLQRDGYRVSRAEDGRTALDAARADVPDLVVLDLMLPGVSGWDVCRELRRNPRTSRVPIIMLTARDEIADRVVGLELAPDDYVVKPFDPKELVARVHAVLRRVNDQAADGAPAAGRAFQRGDLAIDRDRYE